MEDLNKKYLTKFNIFSFAASGFGQNLIIGIVNSFLLYFYTDVFVIPLEAVLALMLFARIFDALNDPVMGSIVDRTRTKWGKLRPYLIGSALPLGIVTVLLFWAPDLSSTGKLVYAYITYFAFGIIYTICDVPFWGLASAMTPNPKERISFITVSRLVHSIGGALPIVMVPFIVDLVGSNNKGYFVAGLIAGVLGAALFTLSFFGTKERCVLDENKPTLKDNIKFFLLNKPLQRVVLANVLGFARAIAVTASMYLAVYLLGDDKYNIFLLASWGVAGYVGMVLTPMLTKKYNYSQIYYISAAIGVITSLLIFGVTMIIGQYNLIVLAVGFFLAGMPYGVVCNINYAMIADSVDYVEWKTGKRSEGISVSFQTLMNKLMTALQTATVTLMLIIAKFVQPIKVGDESIIQPQTEHTLLMIFILLVGLPIIGWIVSVLPMMKYDFIGEKRIQAHKDIVERRAAMIEEKDN
jgi:sugar (glycoside-pentoside-hexuronide) transporter